MRSTRPGSPTLLLRLRGRGRGAKVAERPKLFTHRFRRFRCCRAGRVQTLAERQEQASAAEQFLVCTGRARIVRNWALFERVARQVVEPVRVALEIPARLPRLRPALAPQACR